MRRWLFLLVLLAACEGTGPDVVDPTCALLYPAEGDTLDPGAYTLVAVAADDKALDVVSFWCNGEFLGIPSRSSGDTFRIGWDCAADTGRSYTLGATAEDGGGNWTVATARVFVRRAACGR